MRRSAEAFYFSDKNSAPEGTPNSCEVVGGHWMGLLVRGGCPAIYGADRGRIAGRVPRAAGCDLVSATGSRSGPR
ncbi:hypothetical protein NDU88_005649 [Pleurodeles waltl]|uniref:Uncharacterized protein n=1 Tax=Pleurodeles waltl TaxID=8319 RepID=A0AAV7VJK8_PLEWA|nr:hypothetical protein NDU88_005649 [Pleurodeles waltl]